MNRDSLKGTGKVYAFTFGQLLKSKSNIVTLAVFCMLAVFATPVACLILGGSPAPESSEIACVYISNETEYPIEMSGRELPFRYTYEANAAGENFDQLSDSELFARIRNDNESGEIVIQIIKPAESVVSDSELELVRSEIYNKIAAARFAHFGASQAQLEILMADYTIEVFDEAEFGSSEIGFAAAYSVQYAFAIVLLIVCMFTIIYIIRAVVEEKASKLVELLMTSVKPLALLAGKILAVMTFIFGMLLVVVLLFTLSYFASGVVLDTSPITDMMTSIGINTDVLNIGPVALVSVFISLILAYMTFSIIAGLLGTTCSSMDDVNAVNGSVTLLIMSGYIFSVIISASGISVLAVSGSLVPIVSAFVAPVQYILGGIGFGTLAVSWLIQIIVIAALAVFAARVYRGLIMHSGTRIKLRTLFSMYDPQAGKEVL